MTTKEIIAMCAIYFSLKPKYDRYKTALDKVLSRDLPIKIQVAAPFKCFKSSDKKHQFKLKITNTETKECIKLCPTHITKRISESKTWVFGNRIWSGGTRENWIAQGMPENAEETTHYPCTSEEVTSTGWSSIGLAVSKLFKSNIIFFDTCHECNGTGYKPWFAHISEGICFNCLGVGGRIAINGKIPVTKTEK